MTNNSPRAKSYSERVCDRCGSKRVVVKTWREKIKNYSGSFTYLKMTKTICSNTECQKLFEKKRAETLKRNKEMMLKKEAQEKIRKENIHRHHIKL
jgi:hypothetical protein